MIPIMILSPVHHLAINDSRNRDLSQALSKSDYSAALIEMHIVCYFREKYFRRFLINTSS